jgi:glycolate oxidase iron-sulfur subunit
MAVKTKNEYTHISKFEKDLAQCMKCGFCTYWCPVYQESRVESSVARGKNLMVRGLLDGELDFTEDFARRLNECTLCMTCTVTCPARARIADVVVAARADTAAARGLKFPYNLVYRRLLPHRRLFGTVVRVASWFQGVFLPRTKGSIRHLAAFLSALGKGRQIPEIAPRFLRQLLPVVNKPPEGVKTKVTIGYFTGCMTEYVFPGVGQKIVDFLTRNGVEVVMPREQGCCGAPVFLGSGDFEAGRRYADANVEAFENLDYVITDCATCGSAMKDYVKFLADTPEREKAYSALADKVKDITEFLVDVLQLEDAAYKAAPEFRGKKVTWHDPCHLNRHMGIKEQPRKILRAIEGIEYVEMTNADRCCGMAGSFSIEFYELSQKIAGEKVNGIRATGADVVVTDCPGCQIQLIDSTIREGLDVEVRHIMELLD